TGTQALDDRIAAEHHLRPVLGLPAGCGTTTAAATRVGSLGCGPGTPCGRVVGPVLGPGGGATRFEAASPLPTGPDDLALLRAALTNSAATLRIACHHCPAFRDHSGPLGVSVTSTPAPARRSRTSSATAQIFSARADVRRSRSALTNTSSAASAAEPESPVEHQCSSSGSTPRMPSILRTCEAICTAMSRSPLSSALLPSL